MKRILIITAVAVIAVVSAGSLLRDGAGSTAQAGERRANAQFRDASGNPVGTAQLKQRDGVVEVRVNVWGLAAGFHGFHVHAAGLCEGPSFATAGGHFNPGGAGHPHHAADMPVLLVNADGTGEARFKTDRYGIGDLFDADGSALMIHASPDNYANIPTARYDPDPDATTLATGDAGARSACAVIRGR